MSFNKNIDIGKYGEQCVADLYKSKGYSLFESNYADKFGEIDLILVHPKEKEIIFCEVKTRTNYEFISPIHSINKIKRKKIAGVTEYFLSQNKKYENYYARFDVAIVYLNSDTMEYTVEIKENAFDSRGNVI